MESQGIPCRVTRVAGGLPGHPTLDVYMIQNGKDGLHPDGCRPTIGVDGWQFDAEEIIRIENEVDDAVQRPDAPQRGRLLVEEGWEERRPTAGRKSAWYFDRIKQLGSRRSSGQTGTRQKAHLGTTFSVNVLRCATSAAASFTVM